MNALHIRELHVRRMPGVEDGGFRLTGLVPGINLIHGPNASGKTTSARALHAVLWPGLKGAERAALNAEFTLDGVQWSASVEAGRAEHQRDGVRADLPALPSEAERDRYSLALHELLQSEDAHFAEKILRESAGGYDVAEAGAALRPRTGAPRSGNEVRALEEAQRNRRTALEAQERIRWEETSLERLESERQAAEKAVLRAGLLEDACAHASARDAERDARIAMEPFPVWIARLRGDETGRLKRIREQRADLVRKLERAEEAARRAEAAIAGAALPEGGLPGHAISALREDWEALREAEREIRGLEQEQSGLRARMEEERQRIGAALGEAEPSDLDHADMTSLANFCRRAGEAHVTRRALELELGMVGDAAPPKRADVLDEGVRLLQCWLREPAPAATDDGPRRLGIIAAALLIAAGGVFAFLNLLALSAVVAGAVLLVLLLGRSIAADDAGPVHRRGYEALRLDAPAAWTPAEVARTLRTLQALQAEAQISRERQRRHAEISTKLREHLPVVEALEAERLAVAERLGVAPGLDEGHLFWLASRVSRWQDAHAELTAGDERYATAASTAGRLRSTLRERLAAHVPLSGLATTGELRGAIDDLEARQRTLLEARSDLQRASTDRERLQGDLEGCHSEERGIFEALGLSPAEEQALAEWTGRIEEYRKKREHLQSRVTLLAQARERLESRGGEARLLDAAGEELELELQGARAAAVALDGLRERIFTIRHEVASAKRSHDIEAALEREERCAGALRETRDADVRGVIARVLIDHVQEETRDQHLPTVFHSASELFTRLTSGRYELRFETRDGPRFRAFDNREGRGRSLEQLSSGTRVQLLLAVRVAFVESQEQRVKLPLVLDEVLGNSDDERAGAIIEAAIELVRDGRQIFYFTAQHDEIGKWRSLLERHPDVEHRAIDLREVRRGAAAADLVTGAATFQSRQPVPHPDDDDHLAYGLRLRVPRIDRGGGRVGELHLWYLTRSPAELHRLLLVGPERWGEMESFLGRGGERLLEAGVVRRLALTARAADLCIQESRIGAGKRVDREAIESSAAVTAAFLDRVVELASERRGDAAALVDALREKAIARFREGSIDALESYLEQEGYLDRRPRLEPREIHTRVLAALATEIRDGEIAPDEVESLLQRLFAGMEDRGGGDAKAQVPAEVEAPTSDQTNPPAAAAADTRDAAGKRSSATSDSLAAVQPPSGSITRNPDLDFDLGL